MVTAVKAGLAAGALCAMLACVPTAWYAEQFAHPARVARLGGAVPEATVAGAAYFPWRSRARRC